MSLRTRIAVTFLLLLAAVLTTALVAVSAANRGNAQREVQRQLDFGTSVFSRLLETNRRQLTQAAQAVASDYGFREAVAAHDTATLESALQNSGDRIGAAMVVLTSLNGNVIAATGSQIKPGTAFPITPIQQENAAPDKGISLRVDDGRIFELVTVAVRSPLPVAWIAMGFELDSDAALEFATLTGLGVTLSVREGNDWREVVTTLPRGSIRQTDLATRRIELSTTGQYQVVATLSRSLTAARAPFERLTRTLYVIAGVSLLAFAWAAFWLARNITRPLQNLTESVDQIRGGAYAVSTSVDRNDELGVLAQGLKDMQSAVQSRDLAIRKLAYEDSLTGLMNRTAFIGALTAAMQEPQPDLIAVALINLHRFRGINEHLGYSVGDAVLIRVAERLNAVPSVTSAVGRLSADQFVAYGRIEAVADLSRWGTSLLVALSDPVQVEMQPIDISATVGLAQSQGTTLTADELLRCADLALASAKRAKRPLAIYEEHLKPASREQLSLLGELRQAVEQGELRTYFQPKIELATQRVAGAEVLLRWQHPTRGLLNPMTFVPFAEQTGFIRRITRWTLENAIAQAAIWHRAGHALPLAVNVSAADIADPRMDSRIAGLLTKYQLPPALLTLELTETSFIEDPERALQMMMAISALGVNLSIDDFGTGYSSLSLLARMPVNEVKIDRSFITGLESDPEFGTVVRSAIDMGHSLGLKVVAEGIETEKAAAYLRDCRCDIAQGYLYAKPMALEVLQHWMQGRERVPVIALPPNFNVDAVTDTLSLVTL